MAEVKYCESCGLENDKKAKFCDDCGKPFGKTKEAPKDKPSELKEGEGLGIISLVSSILGFTCLPGIGFIVALITGFMTPNPKEHKYAKAGIFIGSIGLMAPAAIAGVVLLILTFVTLGEATDDLIWMPILSVIFLIASGISLFFFIRWAKKPVS
ncbi:MAG: hypothetical protein FK733_17750 [Asgard group archaeon]|nr:hypothetical protein [Asgard group archaeon]